MALKMLRQTWQSASALARSSGSLSGFWEAHLVSSRFHPGPAPPAAPKESPSADPSRAGKCQLNLAASGTTSYFELKSIWAAGPTMSETYCPDACVRHMCHCFADRLATASVTPEPAAPASKDLIAGDVPQPSLQTLPPQQEFAKLEHRFASPVLQCRCL